MIKINELDKDRMEISMEADDALWHTVMKRLERAKDNGTLRIQTYTEIEEVFDENGEVTRVDILPYKTVIFKYEEKL